MALIPILQLALAQEEDNFHVPRNISCVNLPDAFKLPDNEFINEFRLSKDLVHSLIEELRPSLEPRSFRRNILSVENKVLCALSFFAAGCYQRRVGGNKHLSISQQGVSNVLKQVVEAMNSLLQKYIRFPTDRETQEVVKREFFEYCGLPGVLGAIDCTHVAIVAPSDTEYYNEKNFLNRKLFHSINVQLVCDMQMCISNILARFPGSCHDAFIWRSSNLYAAFERRNLAHGNGWLLGDSGYPAGTFLKTPHSDPLPRSPEERFNRQHSRGRSVIERLNGILKSRFRCLLKHRTLHYGPEMACKIINACAILHNMCINEQIVLEDCDLDEEDLAFDTLAD